MSNPNNPQRAPFPTQGVIKSTIPCPLQEFYSADSIDKAEFNEPNYLVEVLNLISGTALLPDHFLFTQKGLYLHATSNSLTKEFSRQRFTLHCRVHDD